MPTLRTYGGAALQEMFRVRGQFEAAQSSRYKAVRSTSAACDADFHIRNQQHYFSIVELARSHERDSPLLAQALRRLVAQVNPGAMRLSPGVGNDTIDTKLRRAVNARLKTLFGGWGSNPNRCDNAGEHDWHSMCNLACGRTVADGDFLAIPYVERLTLKLFESHRCRSPGTNTRNDYGRCGVAIDADGRPTTYWFAKGDCRTLSTLKTGDVVPVPARDEYGEKQVFHNYRQNRLTQRRGISSFCPVATTEGMRDTNEFNNLVKSAVASCYTIFRKREFEPNNNFTPPPVAAGAEGTDTDGNGNTLNTIDLHPGLEIIGQPGEELEGFCPNIPNAEFFQLERLLLTYLAINLDLPLIILLLDASDSNLSQWRGVMQVARDAFHEMQRQQASLWHAPIYRWLVRQWVEHPEFADDELLRLIIGTPLDPNIAGGWDLLTAHTWHPPGYPYIEPAKDAAADVIKGANSLESGRRFASRVLGIGWEEHVEEVVEDRSYAIARATEEVIELRKRFPNEQAIQDLTYHHLFPFPAPEGVQMALAIAASDAGEQPAQPAAAGKEAA